MNERKQKPERREGKEEYYPMEEGLRPEEEDELQKQAACDDFAAAQEEKMKTQHREVQHEKR